MTVFPTAGGDLTSWARCSPQVTESGGKRKGSNATGRGNPYLGETAVSAGRTQTVPGGGRTETVPGAGRTQTVPGGGRTQTVPGAGRTQTFPGEKYRRLVKRMPKTDRDHGCEDLC
ncbi:MAG TPA: hypothetical protein VFQ44_07685 [Streptosporangiaceae bacterium]|nr:hypothetical protein [Streptosporangiaceae bacterium]